MSNAVDACDFDTGIRSKETGTEKRQKLTFPTRDDGEYGQLEERAPHTFEMEPGHMHYYADKSDLEEWLAGFRLVRREKRERRWEKDGVLRFSSRWQVLAEKQ